MPRKTPVWLTASVSFQSSTVAFTNLSMRAMPALNADGSGTRRLTPRTAYDSGGLLVA